MKLQIKNSSVLDAGSAKAPTQAQMAFGEIALNYVDSDPTLFYKDSANVIRNIKLNLQPDMSDSSSQSGTLDDRYVRVAGATFTGDVTAPAFLGGVARISATPPTATAAGELWYNTDDGRTYIYYTDADSSQWVDAAPDTFELTDIYYTKNDADARFLQLTGGTLSGTLNLDGTGTGSVLNIQNSSSTTATVSADGTIKSGTAGAGALTDEGYKFTPGGAIESYAPSTASNSDVRFKIVKGTTTNASITLNGDATFTSVSGDGNGLTNLSGSVIKTAYEGESDTNAFTDAEKTKLSNIDVNAEPNVATNLAYDSNTRVLSSSTGTNATLPEVSGGTSGLMTSVLLTKLNGIETSATADQTGAEIKAAYEGEANTNAFTDAEKTSLSTALQPADLGNYDDSSLFTFDGSGNFTATGDVTAFSDIRLKTNIKVIPDAVEKINQLRGVTFDRTDVNLQDQTGVIAQEVEAVLPQAVHTICGDLKTVAYGNMVGLLIEAIKELSAEIKELKGE